jgi:hypothetical protein
MPPTRFSNSDYHHQFHAREERTTKEGVSEGTGKGACRSTKGRTGGCFQNRSTGSPETLGSTAAAQAQSFAQRARLDYTAEARFRPDAYVRSK